MYEATTRGVGISVTPTFMAEQSEPEQDRYFWTYTIKIENDGDETVQLLTRHWRITDANGHTIEVKGDGVVGEQPVLRPGESFHYTSGTPLPTPSGMMVGSYGMRTAGGEDFDVVVPAFSLDLPNAPRQLH